MMNGAISCFGNPVLERLGLVLLHFFWQGAVVAVCLACVLRMLRRKSSDARYAVSLVALSAMALLPIATFLLVEAPDSATGLADGASRVWQAASEPVGVFEVPEEFPEIDAREETEAFPEPGVLVATDSGNGASVTASSAPFPRATRHTTLSFALPWVVAAWSVGVLLLSIRLAVGWAQIARLKRCGTQVLGEPLLSAAHRLSEQLGVRRTVRFVDSRLASVPCLIGVLRPTILLPACVLTKLSAEQVELILAHELAHVRRHDCLVTVVQAVVEVLLFYHPAVWWVSRCLRIERENSCDDFARSISSSPLFYAQTLADLSALVSQQNEWVAAANGADLLTRIRRIVGAAPAKSTQPASWWATGLLAILLLAMPILASHESTVSSSQAEETGLAAAEESSNDHPFRIVDDFDGKLALDWEVIRPDASHVSLTKHEGKLTITAQPGGLHADERTDRGARPGFNLYMVPNPDPEGDFVVTTCLEGFHPNIPYQQAGIHIYDDDDNYIKVSLGYNGSAEGIGVAWESNYVFRSRRALDTNSMNLKRVWLRATKRGNAYETAYSFDGKKYVPFYEQVWGNGSPKRVGLAVMTEGPGNNPIDAVFDFFEIRSLTPEEAGNPAAMERRKFVGLWEAVADSDGGAASDSGGFEQISFNGSEATIRDRGKSLRPLFAVYPDTEPKSFGFSFRDRGVVRSAYRFEGDQLIVCMNTQLDGPAPTEFESAEGHLVARFRRVPAVKARALQFNQLNALQRFRMLDANRDSSLVLEEFVAGCPAPEAVQRGRELFAILDRDKNGKLDYDEFKTQSRQAARYQYDLDADGKLSEEEFAAGEMKQRPLATARELFQLVDRDGNGQLDAREFLDRSAEAWFASLDRNEDGVLTYREYADGNPELVRTARCRAVFNTADANSDGTVDRKEYLAKGPTFLFRKMDGYGNADGRVTLNEFTQWLYTPEEKKSAESEFEAKDVDGSGFLSLDEYLKGTPAQDGE